jgi:hypothetical protein
MNRLFLASTLGNDPHTEGIHNASKIARLDNIEFEFIPPSVSYEPLCIAIKEKKPQFLGLSYRLTPEIGCRELEKILHLFVTTGLIHRDDGIKIGFAGLPETIQMVKARLNMLPLNVHLIEPYDNIIDIITDTLDYFEISHNREKIFAAIKDELVPEGIKLLDQLADEVISDGRYVAEPPLPIPSEKAKNSLITRIHESSIPLLRSHFGLPGDSIEPTVQGISEMAESRVIDEISLGSSDLSQRYFGQLEQFTNRKNDGGVPYKTREDLVRLFQASRKGNFPSLKPYCHVVDIVPFIHTCLESGMLLGAHQAIPLFWFNELDGRGPTVVRDSLREHFAAVKELARLNIPVEMNDPNQWSSRWAHDTMIVASYALISAVMHTCGVKNMLVQMQFNKPKETGDYADLAKMAAGMEIAAQIAQGQNQAPFIIKETRTGIESISSDMKKAKWQLARSTLLQMCMEPHIIHIVSYCEANHAATAKDIIDSSKLVRKAVHIFNKHKNDIRRELQTPVINERKDYLLNECNYLLKKIAELHPAYNRYSDSKPLSFFLGDENVLALAIEKKIVSAPGIINKKYKGNFITRPMKYGMINLVDNYENPRIMSEKERLNNTVSTNEIE